MSAVQNSPVFPDPSIAERLQAVQIRSAALQAAINTVPTPSTTEQVLAAAAAFAAYLSGTGPAPT